MSHRILLVDDDLNLLETAKDILEEAGYEVIAANSLKSASACLAENSFSLVICDLNLPDGTGLDLADELRSRLPCPRIILMTGELDGSNPAGLSARQAGLVDDSLLKPVGVQQLLQIIKRHAI